jgi:putative endonuclease
MPDWYIYMIRCRDGSLYTGITTDVDRRFAEHREGGNAGAKYLRGRGPLVLVFQKRLGSRSLALVVESRVKFPARFLSGYQISLNHVIMK